MLRITAALLMAVGLLGIVMGSPLTIGAGSMTFALGSVFAGIYLWTK